MVLCSVMAVLRSGLFGGGSAVEELERDGDELVVELEDAAVTGVGVDDQLGVLDPAMEIVGEHGGDHPVVVAVGDQGRLGDLRQVGGGRAAPSLCFLLVGLERLYRDRLVAIPR